MKIEIKPDKTIIITTDEEDKEKNEAEEEQPKLIGTECLIEHGDTSPRSRLLGFSPEHMEDL